MKNKTKIYKFGGQYIKTGQIISINVGHFRAGKNVAGQRKGKLFALKKGIVKYQTIGRRSRKRTYISVREVNND